MAKARMKARTKNAEEIPALYRDFGCEINDCKGSEEEGFYYRCTFFKGMKMEAIMWIESDLLIL